MRYFGDALLPAPDSDKRKEYTKKAEDLVARSTTAAVDQLSAVIAESRQLYDEVIKYVGWSANGIPCWTCYESSQIIKSNLTQARMNAETRSGQHADYKVQGPMETVSVLKETVKELPAAVVERAGELAQGKVWSDEQCQVLGLSQKDCEQKKKDQEEGGFFCTLPGISTVCKHKVLFGISFTILFVLGGLLILRPYISILSGVVGKKKRRS